MSDSPKLPKHFPKVREAREALTARALEIQDLYLHAAKKALEADHFEEALEAYKFLMLHMPTVDGTKMLDQDVDKPKVAESGPKGPQIQIGIALGGLKEPKKLPEPKLQIVDITPEREKDEHE